MSRSNKYIKFEGIFASGVLGIFRVIRGFADLRDLAAVSVPFKMTLGNEPERVFGHQRELDERHAKDIKTYLERSDNRFIPEVILSIRCDNLEEINGRDEILGIQTPSDSDIFIKRRFSGKNYRIQQIRVRCSEIDAIKEAKRIRRIDGNHRLAFAETLEDTNLKQKYLAPFCMILLGPTEDTADDYAESLIFHTINSTALRLKSEHGLRLLLWQDPAYAMTHDNEFAYSPELHLTRLLYERFRGLSEPARNRFGEQPLTTLGEAAQNMIAMNPNITESRTALTNFAEDLFAGLADILTRLSASNPSLCQTHSFLDLAARVWWESSSGDNHEAKVQNSVQKLERLGKWLGDQGITNLLNPLSPAAQLLETFNAVQSRIPKRLFLARWYPSANSNWEAFNRADLRLQQIIGMLDLIEREHGIRLELIDMGTEEGGTFPIQKKMYEAIASADIIMCDLTGQRSNVYVEAGFALRHHEQNRLIFLFEPMTENDKAPFDLSTFKYVQISQAAEIHNKVKPEIVAILRGCGANI